MKQVFVVSDYYYYCCYWWDMDWAVEVLDIHVYVDDRIRVNLLPWPKRLKYLFVLYLSVGGVGGEMKKIYGEGKSIYVFTELVQGRGGQTII